MSAIGLGLVLLSSHGAAERYKGSRHSRQVKPLADDSKGGSARCCIGALPRGVIVDDVERGSDWESAGLRQGDILVSWARHVKNATGPVAAGTFDSPFDLTRVDGEEVSRGDVQLAGLRGTLYRSWMIKGGSRIGHVSSTPILPKPIQGLYVVAREAQDRGLRGEALQAWDKAASLSRESGNILLTAFLIARKARLLMTWNLVGDYETYERAARLLDASGNYLAEAYMYSGMGWAALESGEKDQRVKYYFRQASEAVVKSGDQRLIEADILLGRAIVAQKNNDRRTAHELRVKAHSLTRALAPKSFASVVTAHALAREAEARGDYSAADSMYRRNLALQQELGLEMRTTLKSLADTCILRGDFAYAEDLYQRISRGTSSYEVAWSRLAVLGLARLAEVVGDHQAAQSLLRRKIAALGREKAWLRLGLVRGRLEPIDEDASRSLALTRLHALWSLRVAVERELSLARARFSAGGVIFERLKALAQLDLVLGNYSDATRSLKSALVIAERYYPECDEVAPVLLSLCDLAIMGHRLAEARSLAQTVLRRFGGQAEAQLLARHSLGRIERIEGRYLEAAQDYCEAVDILEVQSFKSGLGDERLPRFVAKFAGFQFDCVDALVHLGRPREAFHRLEAGRARAFRSVFTGRVGGRATPISGSEDEVGWVRTEYDRISLRLAIDPPVASQEDASELRDRLMQLDRLRDRRLAKRLGGGLASAREPGFRALDLQEVLASLDSGTSLLAYLTGPEGTLLFVIRLSEDGKRDFSVIGIPVGARSLRQRVSEFRRLLLRRSANRELLEKQGESLFELLLKPAEPLIEGSKRILLLPDDSLYSLPFASLRRGSQFLAEWKPIHSALSATVYREIRQRRQERVRGREGPIAAFGNPEMRRPPRDWLMGESRLLCALKRRFSWRALPGTLEEVQEIGRLIPGTRMFLGRDASEEMVKQLSARFRILHFATHAFLDREMPFNTALVLSLPEQFVPGRENGLLQAWEIMEDLHLNADLVTLSACDTALGQEMGGEGMIGLARAFQFAGARSVLATLWSISDSATARFMPRFYQHLLAGETKDEALRHTQMEWIRNPETANPYYWAPFELIGDYR